MRKWVVPAVVLALLVVGAVPVLAGPGKGKTGFKLTGTDAAYADFDAHECTVFVGYVWAKKLKFFDTGQVIRPHSDLEVKLYCGEATYEGVVSTVDDDRAEIVMLTSAEIDEIPVPLTTSITATVDLTWTAIGDVFKEEFRDSCSRSNHRTRWADVVGKVTVTGLGSSDLAFTAPNDVLPDARITHYNERGWC